MVLIIITTLSLEESEYLDYIFFNDFVVGIVFL